jgi:hypothetical protein
MEEGVGEELVEKSADDVSAASKGLTVVIDGVTLTKADLDMLIRFAGLVYHAFVRFSTKGKEPRPIDLNKPATDPDEMDWGRIYGELVLMATDLGTRPTKLPEVWAQEIEELMQAARACDGFALKMDQGHRAEFSEWADQLIRTITEDKIEGVGSLMADPVAKYVFWADGLITQAVQSIGARRGSLEEFLSRPQLTD